MIDTTKEYKVHGTVFSYNGYEKRWTGRDEDGVRFYYSTQVLERFLRQGYATEVASPISVEFNAVWPDVSYDERGLCCSGYSGVYRELRDALGGNDLVANKRFKIEITKTGFLATEVL